MFEFLKKKKPVAETKETGEMTKAAEPPVSDALNRVDLCFVIDTTGSMGPFIRAAQRQLLDTMQRVGAASRIDLQVGLVQYRDHPPQDHTFVTRVHPLTASLGKMQKVINGLSADGGGDAPEAVYDGVYDACTKLSWRDYSFRFALLVGDAPSHGWARREETQTDGTRRRPAHGDGFADGCPCGLDASQVTAAAETKRVTLHALAMRDDAVTRDCFAEISRGTGGTMVLATEAERVVDKMVELLERDFYDLELDRRVLETMYASRQLETGALAEAIPCSRAQAASSLARLGKRGLLRGLYPARVFD
jgi:hypothetical protein